MTTMSDDGERTCPLCAEEMDLTDQQLKPCKCGYEICVWCWHQINNIAEKEEIEGRCPACRTPYDKERIVGMAANCERVVAEINAEKKQKSQKSKAKTSVEAKKHLSTVRVVQRNLVYIIGLPAKLCDETILQRKEYFGQYGKVLKVSISRPTSVPSQQTPSNCTVSVYITYAREEEAIRCIQAVHNYALEGKMLRACFGTTKYCHAWLRNMSCSNPDCMYLHDIGSQEDSFTKDEIISAYTWSRVPQIALNNSQWRSGNILPPPADDFSNNVTTSGKNQVRSVSNIHPNYSLMSSISQVKGSPNSGSPVKPTVLPISASWGHRNSNGRPTAASAACSQVPCAKQKVEVVGNSCLPHILTESTKHFSAWNDEDITVSKVPELHSSTSKSPSLLVEDINESSSWDEIVETLKVPEDRETMQINGTTRPIEPFNLSTETVRLSDRSSKFSLWNKDVTSKLGEENKLACLDDGSMQPKAPEPVYKRSQRSASNVPAIAYSPQLSSNFLDNLPVNTPEYRETFVYADDDNTVNNTNPKYFDRQLGQFVTVGQSSSTINRDRVEELNVDQLQVLDCIDFTAEMPPNHGSDSTSSRKVFSFLDKHGKNELKDQNLKEKLIPAVNGGNGNLLPCDNKMHGVPESFDQTSSHYLNDSYNGGNFSKCISWNIDVGNKQLSSIDRNFNRKLKINSFVLGDKECTLLDGHKEHDQSSYSPRQFFECPEMNCNEKKDKHLEMVNDTEISDKHATVDMKRESSIISDILSLDVDPWDGSLTTVNDFARLLGETETQERSLKLFSSLKSNTTNQSRFSFARQENHVNPVQPIRDETYPNKFCSSSQDSYDNGPLNGIMFNSFQTPTTFINDNLVISSDKVADGTSRAKIPAPPGFTAPSRAPPPGFCSQDRLNQIHEPPLLENHLLGYPIGNHYQMHPAENLNDIEFIDPAILAVGKGQMSPGLTNSGLGLKSTFPSQISSSHIDPKLHLLMRQSLSYQNLGLPDSVGDRFFPLGDAYTPSRSAQNHSSFSPIAQMSLQQLNNTAVMNKQWDGRK